MKYIKYLCFLILGVCAPCASAIVVETYNDNAHNRFANDPSFIGAGFDWSGVARSSQNGDWATMISPTCFITTTHSHPLVGHDLVFHEDNDPAGSTVSRTVASLTQVGDTDIMIGCLDVAVPATIATYCIVANPTSEALIEGSPYDEREVFTVGRNNPNANDTTNFVVGRNVIDAYGDDISFGPPLPPLTTDSFGYTDDRGTPESLGADESFLQGGDSGAPTFIVVDGQLVLLGIHRLIATTAEGEDISVDAFLPNYMDEILTLSGGTAFKAVPEPSSMLMLFLATVAFLAKRRR